MLEADPRENLRKLLTVVAVTPLMLVSVNDCDSGEV